MDGFRGRQLRDAGISTGFGDEWVRIGGVKYGADGSASERTMRMSTPFEGRPDDYGILTMSQEEIHDAVEDAHRHNWQVGIHANSSSSSGTRTTRTPTTSRTSASCARWSAAARCMRRPRRARNTMQGRRGHIHAIGHDPAHGARDGERSKRRAFRSEGSASYSTRNATTGSVSPEAARQGCGSALVHEIEPTARANGVARLDLYAALNAEQFYVDLGYDVLATTSPQLRPPARRRALLRPQDRCGIERRCTTSRKPCGRHGKGDEQDRYRRVREWIPWTDAEEL